MQQFALTCLLFLSIIPARATISVVQSGSAQSASSTTVTITFSRNTQAGNLLFVAFATASNTATMTLDSADTWTALETSPFQTASLTKQGSWFAPNIVGGKTAYTFTRSSSGTLCASLIEVSGVLASPFDVSQHGTATFTADTNAVSGNTATPAQANEIWITGLTANGFTGGGAHAPSFSSPATGTLYGAITANDLIGSAVVTQTVTAAAAASSSVPVAYNSSSSNSAWVSIIATFKGSAVGSIGVF